VEINNKKPLVSIIMNCFNGQNFLKDSIESVKNQTYQNWELIFWDNRSNDKSAEIFKSYDEKRFKYFCADKHTTLYEARNLAIEKSNGDFIAFLDTDDLWCNEKLEMQMDFFSNSEVGLVYSNLWIIKNNINKRKIYTKKNLARGFIYNDLIKNYNIGILTVVLRKKFYLKLKKKFDERFSIIGDFDLFLRLSKLCIFESVQKPLAFYRLHAGNLSAILKEKEIKEHEMWLNENKDDLGALNFRNIRSKLDYNKLVNYKIDGKYKECFNILLNRKSNIFNMKNLFILIMPAIILKKFLWFYQD
tara:strand:- start:636 stop:1544 length:909 start_codon:yes stop_codon:yes gene_type:complete